MQKVNIDATAMYKFFGEELRKLRKLKNLKQRELASLVDLDRTSIAKIEKGKQAVSLEVFCRLLAVFNVPPELLLPSQSVEQAPINFKEHISENKIFSSEELSEKEKNSIIAALDGENER